MPDDAPRDADDDVVVPSRVNGSPLTPFRPLLTRRSFVVAASAVAVAGVAASFAAPVALQRLIAPPRGKRVTELFAAESFSAAHRGGSADWPEMSAYAYQQAVAHGVDALEISLARTSDGVWFGLHDATLDRTSGTSGFVAAEHTWKEVARHLISARETSDPRQRARPYLRFTELLGAFGDSHTIFVDPKVVPAQYFPELVALMKRVSKPRETFVAKGYCTAGQWPQVAAEQGWKSWGYYYGAEIEASPDLLSSTQARWTSLGLDYEASAAAWSRVGELGKPVIGHIIPSREDADRVRRLGAQGLMISGVTEVLG
ncbi:glycerophosphodiester phosphodiesterase [Leifsonia sp. NPDC058248]|uniref:glycerophosphodiester phosphodiesterase n=1 Tax=Leifsonia sp. NPDC058248 TaxID=3346402 RepID=UPI0036D79963